MITTECVGINGQSPEDAIANVYFPLIMAKPVLLIYFLPLLMFLSTFGSDLGLEEQAEPNDPGMTSVG